MTDPCPLPARPRPKFAQYLFDRRLSARDVSGRIGCSHEHARRITLPFDDPDWRKPSADLRERIAVFTDGEVGLLDWSRPCAKAESVPEDVQ